jgi:hypothetical protein
VATVPGPAVDEGDACAPVPYIARDLVSDLIVRSR